MKLIISTLLFLFIVKGYTQTDKVNTICVNYPIVNLYHNDTLKIKYDAYLIKYKNEDDLFFNLDSIAFSMYGNDNLYIKLTYDRFYDLSDNEYLNISKVKVQQSDKSTISIKMKNKLPMDYLYLLGNEYTFISVKHSTIKATKKKMVKYNKSSKTLKK